jgi:hypothetical protein
MYEMRKSYRFTTAAYQCEHLGGDPQKHSYELTVTLRTEKLRSSDCIIPLEELDLMIGFMLEKYFENQVLPRSLGLKRLTLEKIAYWVFYHLKEKVEELYCVEVGDRLMGSVSYLMV